MTTQGTSCDSEDDCDIVECALGLWVAIVVDKVREKEDISYHIICIVECALGLWVAIVVDKAREKEDISYHMRSYMSV